MNKILLCLLLVMAYDAMNPALVAQEAEKRIVKLSPQIRVMEREDKTPTIRLEMIQHFLNRPRLITQEELENAGYIIANAKQTLFATRDSQIYVNGLDSGTVGSQYIIVRLGQAYRSPLEDEEEEVLAYEAIYLGEAQLIVGDEPATLKITSAEREIKNHDRLLPIDERRFQDDFRLHSPTTLQDAYIIAVVNEILTIGKYQIVVINKGLDDGIERAHVLAVYKKGRLVKESVFDEDVILPKRRVGSLLVFRVFDRVSYALVIEASMPINILDMVNVP
ncbi:MAG TPA: hypothetical protein DCM38_11380 [Gammaproteobacteria bacterium]|nr:hypothetical protein [Gammaproteobacteria bacterium]